MASLEFGFFPQDQIVVIIGYEHDDWQPDDPSRLVDLFPLFEEREKRINNRLMAQREAQKLRDVKTPKLALGYA